MSQYLMPKPGWVLREKFWEKKPQSGIFEKREKGKWH
jgi:hypothetical protein